MLRPPKPCKGRQTLQAHAAPPPVEDPAGQAHHITATVEKLCEEALGRIGLKLDEDRWNR